MKKKKIDPIKQEEQYLEFLQKRLNSKNYKSNVSKEEYEKTKLKYEKVKLKLKFLKNEK